MVYERGYFLKPPNRNCITAEIFIARAKTCSQSEVVGLLACVCFATAVYYGITFRDNVSI